MCGRNPQNICQNDKRHKHSRNHRHKTVPAVLNRPVPITVSKGERPDIVAEIHYDSPVMAPVSKGQKLGQIIIRGPENQIQTADLIAKNDVAKVGYFGKLKAIILSWFKR